MASALSKLDLLVVTDFVAHFPRGFVGTKAHVTKNLHRAHALLAGEHEMRDTKPITKRLVRILEDRPDQKRETIAVWGARFALPVPFARRQIVNSAIAATRAARTLWPATRLQIDFAGILVWKHRFELCGRKLMDWLGTFCHGTLPTMEGYCHA
jgi:hypothetical protein